MRFIKFLLENAGPDARKIILATLSAGLLQGVTLFVVSSALDELAHGRTSLRLFLLFLLSIYGYFLTYKFAMYKVAGSAQQSVARMELRVADTLRGLGLLSYERLDNGLVYQAVVGDKAVIVEAGRSVVTAASGLVMMLLAFIFAAFLSMPGFLSVAVAMAICGFVLVLTQHQVLRRQEFLKQKQEAFVLSLKDLLRGFAQLKMSRAKSDDLFQSHIQKRGEELNQLRLDLENTITQAMAFFTSFIFIPVGVVLFILPGLVDIPYQEAIKLIGVVLFIVIPLMGVVIVLPLVAKAEMTLSSVESFESLLLQDYESEPCTSPAPSPEFNRLEVKDCLFAYRQQGSVEAFQVEIDHFHLDRNEVVFITGGNGSGKTSFMKVLAGLYPPQRGQITVNGQAAAELGLDGYRGLFTLILADFHIFGRFYGLKEVDPERVRQLLRTMRLEHKVAYDPETGFSTGELSSGQRRRLALVAGLLEDRPVLLLDEVAADFDPVFRKYFYEEFLPLLREQGKTILAISHDDRYYQVADRVLRMRSGRLEPDGEA